MFSLKKKTVAVVGLGKSGLAAAKFLIAGGAVVRVTEGSDKKEALQNAAKLRALGAEVETGGHSEAFISGADLLVTSPGVPKKSAPLAWARKKKIPVISEIELASRFCPAPIVAVTGSNGKTTTSHLIHQVFSKAGKKSVLCGNIGRSFLDALPVITKNSIVVAELSSFQLEDSPSLRPRISAVLNISPNHLDRHGTLRHYVAAKENIFKNQRLSNFTVLNYDDPCVRRMAKKTKARVIFFSKAPLREGICLQSSWIVAASKHKTEKLFEYKNFSLKGAHNLENILAAAAVAKAWGISGRVIGQSLKSFRTLQHRIEPLGVLSGVDFVNDSKSTTIGSTRAAILAMEQPVVLVAGGRDKGSNFRDIEPLLQKKVKAAVLYGEARDKIAGSWRSFRNFKKEKDFRAAVRLAFGLAEKGDALLLSPMCASFDQFSSFEHRGEVFKEIFRELKRGTS